MLSKRTIRTLSPSFPLPRISSSSYFKLTSILSYRISIRSNRLLNFSSKNIFNSLLVCLSYRSFSISVINHREFLRLHRKVETSCPHLDKSSDSNMLCYRNASSDEPLPPATSNPANSHVPHAHPRRPCSTCLNASELKQTHKGVLAVSSVNITDMREPPLRPSPNRR